ncbi:DUF3857 domain-containing protein [Pontibacter sp. G13]|uniref:DUF3857 domain-containing protein n=1 Tax=Pontibacter sp. G13 TaxID=3074898 RepID=UPI00288ACAA9|nr:DUF3857 domain-containing protein [Pontibacter sp. G13]WNJ16217.1 DUF3857 domain-containing protein [Pontibacter sp. G13]
MNAKQVSVLIIMMVSIIFSVKAQKRPKMGKVSEADLNMERYEPDTGAAAVILLNYQKIIPTTDIKQTHLVMSYYRHVRIKILKPSALSLADIEVPFLSKSNLESISNLKGLVYNQEPDGSWSTTKLTKDNWLTEKLTESLSALKVTFPNVKAGSVIEYSYQLQSYNIRYIRDFYFMSEYPTKEVHSIFHPADGFYYQHNILGEIVGIQQGSTTDYQGLPGKYFFGHHIPAFKEEAYSNLPRNFYTRLSYSLTNVARSGQYAELISNWTAVIDDYVTDTQYESFMRTGGFLKKMYEDVANSGNYSEDPKEQVKAIAGYVRDQFSFNDRLNEWPIQSIGQLLRKLEGNSAELNLLTIGILREAGIKAYPVAISTRNHGIVNPFNPTSTELNHLVARVELETDTFIIDVTNGTNPADMIPLRDLNGEGLLLRQGLAKWVPIEPNHTFKSSHSIGASLWRSGTLDLNMNLKYQGYQASVQKGKYAEAESEEAYFDAEFLSEAPQSELSSIEISGTEGESQSFNVKCEVSTDDFTEVIGDRIIVYPMLFWTLDESPFKLEKRNYPVDYRAPIEERIVLTLEIPEGYEVEEIPGDKRFMLPGRAGVFTFSSIRLGDKLQVMCNLSISQTVFTSLEYPNLKAFMEMVVEKHNEVIVFKLEP